jgi:predicted permease
MLTFWQDLRFGLRILAKSPGFTVIVVLTLAFGIGANTAIFSLIDSIFLQLLPVKNAAQVVDVYKTVNGTGYSQLSYADYLYYRDHAQSFSDLAAQYPTAPINLMVSGDSEQINGSVVTSNYFGLLDLTPSLGRFFLPDEDRTPGKRPIAVISYSLWQRRFGADSEVLGKVVQVNGSAFTIVGVAQQGFQGAIFGIAATDIWIPTAMFRVGYHYCDAFERDCTVVSLLGRLKSGHKIADAQAEMTVLARQLEADYPRTNEGVGVAVIPAQGIRPTERQASVQSSVLLGAVVVVLLIACANLAGLLLVRNTARRKEIALRLALGASRFRIVRQLLTESVLLSVLGGTLGLLVAFWTQELLRGFYAASSEGTRQYFVLSLNRIVLLFALALSFVTGIIFGLLPALQNSRRDLVDALKEEGASSSAHRSRLRNFLVVAQVALSVVLLIGSGLLLRSLENIYRGAGYDPNHLMWLRLRPSLIGYDTAKAWAYQREVIRRVEALPGVVSASPEDFSPIRVAGDDESIWLPGHEPAGPELGYLVSANQVGPRYFETFGIPVLQGREFTEQDHKGTPEVAIVNETLARHFWPDQTAIGRVLIASGHSYEIVGIVKDAQYFTTSQQPPPFLYSNYWQQDTTSTWGEDSRLLVHVSGDPRAMLPAIRKAILEVDSNVPISEDRPFLDWLADEFQPVRMASAFLVCFGALALFLSMIGLHGILAFTVSQRTREIGIRIALGAERSDVGRMVVLQGLSLAFGGALIGTIAALASSRYLASFLYGVRAYDLFVWLIVPAVLICVALFASYLPARRVMHVDPMVALRYE